MRKTLLILISATLFLAGQVTALDMNSSKALQYYGAANTDGNLDFQVNTDGTVDVYGNLDMNGNKIGNIKRIELQNQESVSNGQIVRDNSIGFLAEWAGHGDAVLWDSYNVQGNDGISVSGGKGQESNPQLSVSWSDAHSLDSSGNVQSIEFGDGSIRGIGTTSNGRLWMAPEKHGSHVFSREFGYKNSTETWYAEGGFSVEKGNLDMNGNKVASASQYETDGGLTLGACGGDNCIDAAGNDLHLNHNNGNNVQIGDNGGHLYMNGQSVNNIDDIRGSTSATDIYSGVGGRVLLRSRGSGGKLGWYDDNNGRWVQEYNNGGNLLLDPVGNVKLENANLDLTSNDIYVGDWRLRSDGVFFPRSTDAGQLGGGGNEINTAFFGSGGVTIGTGVDSAPSSGLGLGGNINMNGNQLDNVQDIEMDGDIRGVGVDMSLQEVGSIIGPRNGDTDLNIQTQGSGSHQVSIVDGANNQDIARFHEGTQNVEIPNGDLDITGSLSVGGTECPDDEALLGDGSCGSIGGGTQNLKQVLTAGNTANQSIVFSNGIEIGDSSTAVGSNTDSVAVGKGADASTYRASAFGTGASASGTYSLAAGYNALASAHDGSAFGPAAEASGGFGTSAFGVGASATKNYASAFGSGASALANGSVAIGNNAKAPNQYEATFGNLNGDELDVNVTGDLTVHGSGGLDMKGNAIKNASRKWNSLSTNSNWQVSKGNLSYAVSPFGEVNLRGTVKASGLGQAMFSVPSNRAPPNKMTFTAAWNDEGDSREGICFIVVKSNGEVFATGGGGYVRCEPSLGVELSGIEWPTR